MDLQGWDTAFALSLDSVNSSLAQNVQLLPTELSGTSATGDSVTYEIALKTGPWQIAPSLSGGSGSLVLVSIPIVSGTFSAMGGPAADAAGVVVAVEADLRWLPAHVPGESNLGFDVPAPKSTKSGSIVAGGKNLSNQDLAFFPFVIAKYLAQHAGALTYALAVVNAVAPGTDSWLTPESSTFTILRDATSGSLFLAILSTVAERDISKLPAAVPLSLPAKADAVFLLSQDLVLQRLVQPALPAAFSAKARSFQFKPNKHSIENKGKIALPTVKKASETYHPIVDSLSCSISGSKLSTTVAGTCDMKLGIKLKFSIDSNCPFRFDASAEKISFEKDKNPKVSKDVHIPFVEKFLLMVVSAIINIVVTVIANEISNEVTSSLAKSSAVNQLASIVTWKGLRVPKISAASLDQALILTGEFS